MISNPSANSHTVTGLIPGSLVYIEIFAFVDYPTFVRRWSDGFEFPEVTIPKTPTGVGSVTTDTTTVLVGFEVDQGSYTGWLISYASFIGTILLIISCSTRTPPSPHGARASCRGMKQFMTNTLFAYDCNI